MPNSFKEKHLIAAEYGHAETLVQYQHPEYNIVPRRRLRVLPYIIPAGTRAAEIAARPALTSNDPEITITFRVRASKGPALRSAVEEISSIVGARLEGAHRFSKEHALTDAAIALGSLRAAVNAKVPTGDENYV